MKEKMKMTKIDGKVFYQYKDLLLDPKRDEDIGLYNTVQQHNMMNRVVEDQKKEYHQKIYLRDFLIMIGVISTMITMASGALIGYIMMALSTLMVSISIMDLYSLTKKINKNISKRNNLFEQISEVEKVLREELSKKEAYQDRIVEEKEEEISPEHIVRNNILNNSVVVDEEGYQKKLTL